MLTARLIRRKKPWAVAAAATLLFGFATTAAGYAAVWKSVHTDRFGSAESEVSSLKTEVGGHASAYTGAQGENQGIKDKGKQLMGNLDSREYWLEVYKAVNECLPRDQGDQRDETDITKRHRIKLFNITAKKYADLAPWFTGLRVNAKESMRADDKATGPTGAGYVFTLEGVHYHHEDKNPEGQGQIYVETTLLKNLKQWTVQHSGAAVPVRQLGITHPVLVLSEPIVEIDFDPEGRRLRNPGAGANPGFPANPAFGPAPGFGPAEGFDSTTIPAGPAANRFGPRPGVPNLPNVGELEGDKPKIVKIPQTKFRLQFVWKPTPKADRPAEPPAAPGAPAPGAAPPAAQ
jgi:type IV pilus assembly protein PilM